jgi:putative heme-binding domain-containing protein
VREQRGNPARGANLFAQNCGLCHSLDGVGTPLGPDLGALSDRSAQALLVAILDPNRAINPEYANYLVQTRDGRYLTGVVRDESTGSLRLLSLGGSEVELMRSNVLEIRDLGASMMPTGFESALSVADMADLIAYLQGAGEPPKAFAGNRPALVTADPDGALTLPASAARIHGDTLVFEAPLQNLGYWGSESDRAAWDVELLQAGEWEVTLEYACDDSAAGNELALESAASRLSFRVTGTGGWSSYRSVPLGRLALPAGRSNVTARSAGPIRGALLDLRAVRLSPPGAAPPAPATPQESERIPAIWQVAIAAGRANQTAELHALLERALPRANEALQPWQAVVVGGGLVNGLTQIGVWPRERLHEAIDADTALTARLQRAIELAAIMAHDESVLAGTRYDALRMLGISTWENHGADLVRYLAPDADPELQMGAVSGLGDLADPRAGDALRAALDGLTPAHRALAQEALQRVPSLEQCLASGFDLWGEFALRQPQGPTYGFFAERLPPLRYVNTDFRHYPITLSAPNSTVKARFVSDGSGVNRLAGTSTWHDEGLVPVSFYVGEGALECYGEDPARSGDPQLAEGWLPIVQLSYARAGVQIGQEAFAARHTEDAVVCVRFTANKRVLVTARIGGTAPLRERNNVLLQEDGRILAHFNNRCRFDRAQRALVAFVEPGQPADLFLFTRGARDWPGLSYQTERKACAEHWRRVVDDAARIETGEDRVDNAWKALIVSTLTLAQGDVLNYSAGNFYAMTFEAECGDAARALLAAGVPDAERLVPPLLARTLQEGVFLSDVSYKLQLLAWAHFFRRNSDWTRAQLPLVLPEAERALGWIEAATGLVPAQAYCGDIQTPCHNLYANAAFWRGLRDLARVLRDLGGAASAMSPRYGDAAARLRESVLVAVAASERNDVAPPFLPIALFGVEQPYGLLTETMKGAYWNLVAPYVFSSGIFGPDSPRTAAMVDWQLRRGGVCMGMVRFHQHSGLFANEDALDDLYTLRLTEELLRRDDADRALVSFYGKLAQGMTRDTFVGCEGSGLRPLDERGRAMYLPPNAAANAFFLLTLRHLLVQDFDHDGDGRADALRLLYATPRAWLADGGRIAVERMPTFFGPLSLEVVSELARGHLRVTLDLPRDLAVPARLKLRLPAGYERADGAGEILELAPGGGRREFAVPIRPIPR